MQKLKKQTLASRIYMIFKSLEKFYEILDILVEAYKNKINP